MAAAELMHFSNSAFSGEVIRMPREPTRALAYQYLPTKPWRNDVMNRLQQLVALPRGWDGYRAEPVSLENAVFTLGILDAVCGPDVPVPQIVPGSHGDLQVEWHLHRGDIELHVRSPLHVRAWRQPAISPIAEEELELDLDFSAVAGWVAALMEPDLAPQATAAR